MIFENLKVVFTLKEEVIYTTIRFSIIPSNTSVCVFVTDNTIGGLCQKKLDGTPFVPNYKLFWFFNVQPILLCN